ncbi:hypothetical protein JSO61_009375 [Riemerella anatipestifer]|uniref:hypothetical protein n=1 Tax=Riemerella anatipestifer TaxID=34085 RepID=UPI0030C087C0
MANQIKNIAIKDLTLWDENARFPDKFFNQEESELIQYFLSKADFKIKPLLESIVKDFDLPQLEKIVVWNDGEQNIVLEGNRRLTAYKLLNNPELSKDKKLQAFIESEKQKIDISDNFELECILVENIDDAFRYIDRKHYNGNNEVTWKDTERAHYSKRRGSENPLELIKIGIAKIVRELDLPEEMKEQVLGSGYVTTFYRIVTTTPAKREFKYSLDEKGNLIVGEKDFAEKLKVIIYSVLNKKDVKGNPIDSRALNKTEKIEEFIKSVDKEDTKKVDEEIKSKTTENIFGEKTISVGPSPSKQKVLPKSNSRKYLIPMSCALRIKEVKINNIYRELRENLLLDETNDAVPNAVGVLFRVFLEICLDHYAKMNQKTFKKDETISQKIPWVVKSLVDKGYDNKIFNNINKVGSAKKEHSYLSIDNFHEYVHSTTTQPSSNELKTKWDNLQPFFETLWLDLNKK